MTSSTFSRWLLAAEWRFHPIRTTVAVGAIALGVALGYAIHLINAAAFNEFTAAVKSLSGQSDLQVRGAQPLFDESLFALLAQRPGVALASPVLEMDVTPANTDSNARLKILGVDVMRASEIVPDLTGIPAPEKPFDTLADDAIFLSPAAMEWLKVKQGDKISLRAGTQMVSLRVAGGLVRARGGQRIAVMDIGAAQWRFNKTGQLSRIELKLDTGVNRAAFKAALKQEFGEQLVAVESQDQETRSENLSRAYRVNLSVLALVALFTGAFLVFSTQALAVIRRRSQFALLRVIGVSRGKLLKQILLEGASLGITGALLGLIIGYLLAATALKFFGGDLGGGYFPGVKPTVHFEPLAALNFFLLGLAIALLGSLSPALEAAHAKPAAALKSGGEDIALAKLSTPWPALFCLALGALFTQLPPVLELPVFGYLAVALLLIGSIGLMPRFSALVFAGLFSVLDHYAPGAIATLTLARLKNAPNQASIALGGVLSSFSLMVAMAIMVASFRISVDDWLTHVLPADIYVQTVGGTGLNIDQQKALAATSGVARADFLRVTSLTLDPARPSVALLARAVDAADPGKILPITGKLLTLHNLEPGARPIWVSEAMVDLYGYTPGRKVSLPIAGKVEEFVVAGVWRDYARQFGAIQMRLSDYRALTGDYAVNDAGILLQPGSGAVQVMNALRKLSFGSTLEIVEPGEIRTQSLKIFDRSFAVTYLLEAVAIVIGLFGIATTFSAQALARAKEFGMLRHIGVTRGQVLRMLAAEGGLLTALGILVGFALGWAISLILVFIVNPQSFHWTMQMHLPWASLGIVAALLLVSATVTALVAGRYAVSGNAVQAVREDW